MAKPKYNPEHLDKLELYEQLVAQFPDVKRKGAKNPYTSLNGHMFSFLDQDGFLSLRLPKDAREKFLVDYDTQLSFQYNTVMKEYVVVPHAMLADLEAVVPYFQQSFDYVSSLKPKPTKKSK